MIPFGLHRRIPLIRRPFFQRDQAVAERDTAIAQLAESVRQATATLPTVPNEPSSEMPSHQTAIDLFRGAWLSAMPKGSGLSAGGVEDHFSDGRVAWAADVLGGVAGKTVLELGPFEAYSTYMFEALGAEPLTSIDNSPANFLKCLIVKNAFGLRTTFYLGDFVRFVESTPRKFDICWASGILYHMTEPVRLLEGMARVSDTMFIWTQYFDEAKIAYNAEVSRYFDPSKDRVVSYAGRDIKLHYRNYTSSEAERATNLFAGGPDQFSFWLELPDIMFVLRHLGFARVDMGFDNPDHVPGPACFFLAFK